MLDHVEDPSSTVLAALDMLLFVKCRNVTNPRVTHGRRTKPETKPFNDSRSIDKKLRGQEIRRLKLNKIFQYFSSFFFLECGTQICVPQVTRNV